MFLLQNHSIQCWQKNLGNQRSHKWRLRQYFYVYLSAWLWRGRTTTCIRQAKEDLIWVAGRHETVRTGISGKTDYHSIYQSYWDDKKDQIASLRYLQQLRWKTDKFAFCFWQHLTWDYPLRALQERLNIFVEKVRGLICKVKAYDELRWHKISFYYSWRRKQWKHQQKLYLFVTGWGYYSQKDH